MNIILFEKADEMTFSEGFCLMLVNLQNHKDKSSVRKDSQTAVHPSSPFLINSSNSAQYQFMEGLINAQNPNASGGQAVA